MKLIKAERCGNGWYVKITDARFFYTESEVRQFIRQKGLKVNKYVTQVYHGKVILAE